MTSRFTKTFVLAGALALIVGTSSQAWSGPKVHKTTMGPDKQTVVNIGGGIESVNSKAAVRLEGDATIYTKDRRAALRIDAANLTSEDRRELTRTLLTLGFRLPDDSQLVLSGGYLNRYHEDGFGDGVGTVGDRLDQTVLGLKLTHTFSPITAAYLTALHFRTDSELVHTKEVKTGNEILLKGYGFGGGTQTDILIGFESVSKDGELEIGAGLQRKKFDAFLGNTSDRRFKAKARIKGTIYPTKRSAATFTTEFTSDQKNIGIELTQLLSGPWSMTARADIFRRDDTTDDRQFYLGVNRNFGGDAKIKKKSGLAAAGSHWLKPVNGADTEHLQVVRSLEGILKVTAKAPAIAQLPTGGPFNPIIVGQESAWSGNVASLFTEAGDAITGYEFVTTGGAMPPWVSPVIATNGDIRITGTAVAGNHPISVRAITARGLISDTADLTLVAIGTPTLPSAEPIDAGAVASTDPALATPVTLDVSDRFDPANGQVTYVKTAGPSWLTINPTTGVLSGTPGPADGGYYGDGTVPAGYKPYPAIRVKAVTAQGETEELTINLVVSGPPVLRIHFRGSGILRGQCKTYVGHSGAGTLRDQNGVHQRFYSNGDLAPFSVQLVGNNHPAVKVWPQDPAWLQYNTCDLPQGNTVVRYNVHNKYGSSGDLVEYTIINQTTP